MAKKRVDAQVEEKAKSPPRSNKPRPKNSSGKGRGRALIALVLFVFVILAAGVIWRRTHGITLANEISQLERQITHLESERTSLAGQIRDESSRYRLLRVVEQQGMQLPKDRQVRILSR